MITLNKGDKAPEFTGLDEKGNEISLSDYKGKKLLLFFYPKDNTPGCNLENQNLRDNYDALLKQNIDVLGVSGDSQAIHQRFIEKHCLPFHLIADTEKSLNIQYGVWQEKKNFGKTYMGTVRTSFLINEEGIIIDIIKKVKTKEHAEQVFEILNHG